jgi:hypothetical protein
LFSPLLNSLNNSNLLVTISNCTIFNKTYAGCTNNPLTVKVSDLSVDIRNTFYLELNNYALDNSLINLIFPIFTFAYCLFFVFLFFNWTYEVCGCFKSDLEFARIEQDLIKYFSKEDISFDSLVEKVLTFILNLINKIRKKNKSVNELDKSTTPEPPRNYKLKIFFPIINWITWRPIYFFYQIIFEKSKVDIALEIR